MWSSFDQQFQDIFSRLDCHARLIDREAISAHMTESSRFREEARGEFENAKKERERVLKQSEIERKREDEQDLSTFRDWLSPISYEHIEDRCDSILQDYPNTGDWLLQSPRFISWWKLISPEPSFWVSGIPGAGKWMARLSYNLRV